MKITLDKRESATFFYNSLCNGLGYIQDYGIEVVYTEKEYNTAKAKLKSFERIWDDGSECYEDVLMVMLCTCGLKFKDHEGGMDDVILHIDDLEERMSQVPAKWILQMVEGNDDAETSDVIIQCVLYGEIVFG